MERKRIWGWWFFDWASQPFHTLILTFIFSIYFAEVSQSQFINAGLSPEVAGAQTQALWGYALATAGIIVAGLAPILGAIADSSGRRMVWIWAFSAFYVVGAAGLWWMTPQTTFFLPILVLFGIVLIGAEFTTIFTNALLPGLAPQNEIGRISGSGYAFGYLGGLTSLAVMLALFAENPDTGKTLIGLSPALGLDAEAREGTRFVGPLTAIWYAVFMIPFFLWVRDPVEKNAPVKLGHAMSELGQLLRSLRHRRSLASWLISSMFSRDALNGLYGFGGIYAGTVLGWPVILVGIFGIVSAMAASVISWLGGKADRAFGPKPVIIAASLALCAVCAIVVGMDRQTFFGISLAEGSKLPDVMFFLCGAVIGGAGGALQAASRTLMALHTTPERATEGFGLYALSGKATAFLAPFLIAVTTDISGSQRIGISPLIVMFLLALFLLRWVKATGEVEQ